MIDFLSAMAHRPRSTMQHPGTNTTYQPVLSYTCCCSKHLRVLLLHSFFFKRRVSYHLVFILITRKNLSQSTCFTFPFKQAKDVAIADWTFDITDDRSLGIIKKKYSHLCHVTSVPCTTEDLVYFCQLDGGVV